MTPPRSIVLTRPEADAEFSTDRRPLEFALIRRLFAYTRPHARKRNILLGLVCARAVQLPMVAWTIGAVVNGPIARRDAAGVGQACCGLLALVLSTSLVFRYRQLLALELGESVVYDLRRELFAHLLRQPMSFFDRTKLGRIISRFTTDTEAMRAGVQDVLFVSMVQVGQMAVAALLMLLCDPMLFLVVLGMAPVLAGLNAYFHQRLSRMYRASQESFSRITATVAESVRGVREIQGYVRQDLNAELFRQLVLDHSSYNLGVARNTGVFFPLLELNSQFFISALVLLGGYRVLRPGAHMEVGTLIQFFFLANLFFGPIQSLANLYNTALSAMAGAERVFRFLDTAPEKDEAVEAAEPFTMAGRVEFRNVTFSYAPDRPALSDVSFSVEPGQTVALVGHTGSGKTTIINLLAKFYQPQQGQVLLDGRNLRTIPADDLHRRMGIVLQTNFLFSGTVLDNIRVGREGAGDDEVREAARRLDCLDLLEALPDGLQTRVGERGAGLSLGQRQLICFARAMLADPTLFILDEATSSVDAITEARLQKALSTLLHGRTSFVVAHRLSTIRGASQVLVLDRGRIVERGTHRELVTAGGTYARLYRRFVASSVL